jgi:hypothetical protein
MKKRETLINMYHGISDGISKRCRRVRIEAFFSISTLQAIRRGSFSSVLDLITAIRTFIDTWNERCLPFVGTKTTDGVLAKAKNILASSDGPLPHREEQRAIARVCGVPLSLTGVRLFT